MKFYAQIMLCALLLTACQSADNSPEGRYRTAVAEGLKTTSGPTETVMNINFGIPAQAYYDRCTELNQLELITMGQGGNVTDFQLPDELARPGVMTFGPMFSGGQNRIVEGVTINFMYTDWSPWNRNASAEKLLPDVAAYLARTLPVDFIELDHPRYGRTFVNVEGRRHLAIWKRDDSTVTGNFIDLSTQSGDPLKLLR